MNLSGANVVKVLVAVVAVAAVVQTVTFLNDDGSDRPDGSASSAPEVEMPDVTGFEIEAAEAELRAAGLEADVSFPPAEAAELWSTVTAQIPEPGEPVSAGSTVTLHATQAERPVLALPSASGSRCPASEPRHHEALRVALGNGRVLLGSATESGVIRLTDAQGRVDTLWTTVGYKGPVLVRGGVLDGEGDMTFEQSADWAPRAGGLAGTEDELRFEGKPPGDLGWHALIHFSEPGCYGFQMDGRDFTEHIVVEVKDAVAP